MSHHNLIQFGGNLFEVSSLGKYWSTHNWRDWLLLCVRQAVLLLCRGRERKRQTLLNWLHLISDNYMEVKCRFFTTETKALMITIFPSFRARFEYLCGTHRRRGAHVLNLLSDATYWRCPLSLCAVIIIGRSTSVRILRIIYTT